MSVKYYLYYSEPEEHKMTRKEAVQIAYNCSVANASPLVDTLEALGLLKFEEEKLIEQVVMNARFNTSSNDSAKFISLLSKAGYKIVKKD